MRQINRMTTTKQKNKKERKQHDKMNNLEKETEWSRPPRPRGFPPMNP